MDKKELQKLEDEHNRKLRDLERLVGRRIIS